MDLLENYHNITKGHSGVATFVRKELADRWGSPDKLVVFPGNPRLQLEGGMLVTDFSKGGGPMVVNLYCPNGMKVDRQNYKNECHLNLEKMLTGYCKHGKAVILAGDSNISHLER